MSSLRAITLRSCPTLVTMALLLASTRAIAQTAREILASTGVSRGLAVHIGATDGALECDLVSAGGFVVQGVSLDPGQVSASRAAIRTAGAYGVASIVPARSFAPLPYEDNTVNLLVADLEALGSAAPTIAEIRRVIIPQYGAAYVKQSGTWSTITTPMPSAMDTWTHWDHGPDGNRLSNDSLVNIPRGFQWVVNQDKPAQQGVFIAGGKCLMVLKDQIQCRDAFNGALMWSKTQGRRVNNLRGSERHTIALDDRCAYGLIVDENPCAVDLTTGEVKIVYTNGLHADFGGVDSCLAPNDIWKRACAPFQFCHTVVGDYLVQSYKTQTCVLNKVSGARVWLYDTQDTTKYCLRNISGDGRVFVLAGGSQQINLHYGNRRAPITSILAFDLATGTKLWEDASTVNGDETMNFMYAEGTTCMLSMIYYAYGPPAQALHRFVRWDGATGQLVVNKEFPQPTGEHSWPTGSVSASFPFHWVQDGQMRLWSGARGWDMATGSEVKWRNDGWGGGHVCGVAAPTANSFTAPIGISTLDYATGEHVDNGTVRGVCDQGVYPAYGMIFTNGSGCACTHYPRGMLAVKNSTLGTPWTKIADAERTQKGVDAPGDTVTAWPPEDEWPTWRRDTRRSNYTSSLVSAANPMVFHARVESMPPAGDIAFDWRNNDAAYGRVTAPVAGGGKVLVAAIDQHRVDAWDAHGDGSQTLWSFTAGGRVETPPTIYGGMAIFGSHDGCVYAVRLDDGALVWRFTAAPAERFMMVDGQPESVWPVFGSVAIMNNSVYAAAGRHMNADSGLFVYRLEPATGAILAKARVDINPTDEGVPAGGRKTGGYWGEAGSVSQNDIMVSDGTILCIQEIMIHPDQLKWTNQGKYAGYSEYAGQGLFGSRVPGFPADHQTIRLFGQGRPLYYRDPKSSNLNWKQGDGLRFARWWGDGEGYVIAYRIAFGNGKVWFTGANGGPSYRPLDANGVPDRTVDPVSVNLPSANGVLNLAIAGDHVLLTTNHNGKPQLRIVAPDGTDSPVDLPAPANPTSMAIAYNRIFLTLQDGRLVGFGDGTPVSVRGRGLESLRAPTAQSVAGRLDRGPAGLGYASAASIAAGKSGTATKGSIPATAAPADFSEMMSWLPDVSVSDALIPVIDAGPGALRSPLVLCETWSGFSGATVEELREYRYYPDAPTSRHYTTELSRRGDKADHFAQRITSRLKAPASGMYTFSIATPDAAEIAVYDSDNELLAVAQVDDGEVSTRAVYLEGGSECLVQVLHVEQDGDEDLKVYWQIPDAQREAITRQHLAPLASRGDF